MRLTHPEAIRISQMIRQGLGDWEIKHATGESYKQIRDVRNGKYHQYYGAIPARRVK
jgi:hypothetical protein